MRSLFLASVLSLLSFFSTAHAQTTPVVVELYTSQGCSSCPPADALMAELAKRADVIALSLHVDYWDYLGWKDNFANPAYTVRQRSYARAANHPTIYTPQMIIQGQSHVVGNKPDEVEAFIRRYQMAAESIELRATRKGTRLTITVAPVNRSVGRSDIQLVSYSAKERVNIARGENAGRSITYYNTVNSWTYISRWDGRRMMTTTRTLTITGPIVVIVQSMDHGPILAARYLP